MEPPAAGGGGSGDAPGNSRVARPLCPSAQPDWHGSRLLGVVGGTPQAPRVRFLDTPPAATDELLALAGPLRPTEVFRFAAPCANGACAHFGHGRCRLASKVVQLLAEATADLPPCAIRPECRWWLQEGAAACARCPAVVTQDGLPTAAWAHAADPAFAVQADGVEQGRLVEG